MPPVNVATFARLCARASVLRSLSPEAYEPSRNRNRGRATMIGALLTVMLCAAAFWLSLLWWRSYLNPVALGVLSWTPGLVMMNWPQYFLSPLYIHQNREFSILVWYAMG